MTQSKDNGKERRHVLRIRYGKNEMPSVMINGVANDVLDLSEHGFQMRWSMPVDVGMDIKGVIQFVGGGSIGVEGRVVWEEGGMAGVKLAVPIPAKVIIREHQARIKTLSGR